MMDSQVVSSDGNWYAQVFANKSMFIAVSPMDQKSKAGDALKIFTTEVGILGDLSFKCSKEHKQNLNL